MLETSNRKSWRFRSAFEDVVLVHRNDVLPDETALVVHRTFARADVEGFLNDRNQHALVLDLYGTLIGAPPYRLGVEHDPLVCNRISEAISRGDIVVIRDTAIVPDGVRPIAKVEVVEKPAPRQEKEQEPTEVVCKLEDAEVFCQHEERKPSKDGLLEVVPSEAGDKIKLEGEWEGGCGKHPVWTIGGYWTSTEKKAKTSFNAHSWTEGTPMRWLSGIAPKTYNVTASGCEGSKSYLIKAYPSDELTITFDGEKWEELNEKLEWFAEKVLGSFLKNPHLEVLKGSASVSAQWTEWKDHRAYYKYEASIGFNPVIAAKFRIPFGPAAALPQWLKAAVGSELGFFVEFEGGININGKWARVTPEKARVFASADGFVSGKIGAELKLLSKKVLSIEIAGKSGFGIEAAPDYEEEKPTLLLELKWEGIKGIVSISACFGWIEIEREFNIVDERVIWEKRPFALVKEAA